MKIPDWGEHLMIVAVFDNHKWIEAQETVWQEPLTQEEEERIRREREEEERRRKEERERRRREGPTDQ